MHIYINARIVYGESSIHGGVRRGGSGGGGMRCIILCCCRLSLHSRALFCLCVCLCVCRKPRTSLNTHATDRPTDQPWCSRLAQHTDPGLYTARARASAYKHQFICLTHRYIERQACARTRAAGVPNDRIYYTRIYYAHTRKHSCDALGIMLNIHYTYICMYMLCHVCVVCCIVCICMIVAENARAQRMHSCARKLTVCTRLHHGARRGMIDFVAHANRQYFVSVIDHRLTPHTHTHTYANMRLPHGHRHHINTCIILNCVF